MTYVGRGIDAISNVEKLDNITFDGSTTYNLTKSSVAFTPAGKNNILISINGVIQQGNFTVANATIIFDFSPTSNDTCNFIMHYGTGVLNTPADDTVKTATVQDDAITTDKLANSINSAITANTAKTTNATHSGEVTGATALTIADNIVDEANLKVSNSPTNGYMLTAQSGNTGGLTWASAPSSYYVQLSNLNVSDGDSYVDVQNAFSSTYRNYLVLFEGFKVNTDSADFQCITMKSDNSTPSEHTYQAVGDFYNNAENRWGGSNSSNITIMQGQGSGAGKFISGYINFFNPFNTTDGIIRYTWNVSARKHNSSNGYVIGGGNVSTNAARTGFKLKCNSGTLGGGRVVTYGIKNPT